MDGNNEGWQDQQEYHVQQRASADLPVPFWLIAIAGGLYALASIVESLGL